MTDVVGPKTCLSIGVIGNGAAAGHHCRIASKLGHKLAVFIDSNVAKSKRLAEMYGCGVWSADLDAVLEHDLDLIIVATPPHTHKALSQFCSANGYRALIEKPAALSVSDLNEMIVSAEKRNLSLAAMYQHRFLLDAELLALEWPSDTTINIEIARPRDPVYFQHGWRADVKLGGGVFSNIAIHYLDLATQLIHSEPIAVVVLPPTPQEPGPYVDTRCAALVQFKNGHVLGITATSHSYSRYERLTMRCGSTTLKIQSGMVDVKVGEDDHYFRPAIDPDELRRRAYVSLSHSIAQESSYLGLLDARLSQGSTYILERVHAEWA